MQKLFNEHLEDYDPNNQEHKDPTKYKIHSGTVFAHTMEALRQSQSNDPITNMAILFHDVGKPETQTYDIETKRVQYFGHDKEGVNVFSKIASRLHFSNEQKEAIQFAIENHMMERKTKDIKKSKLLALRQNKNWDVLKQTLYGDEAARQHLFDPVDFENRMKDIEQIYNQFGAKQEFEKRMSELIDGRIIMALVPKIKGVDIGKIKEQTRDWIVSNDFKVTKDDVAQYIRDMANQLGYTV